MKKYFMKNTEDEIQFGDMIELDFTRDTECGVVHHHMECRFLPELIPILLEDEAIEEREVEDEESNSEDCPVVEELIKANEALELRIDQLEGELKNLREALKSLVA